VLTAVLWTIVRGLQNCFHKLSCQQAASEVGAELASDSAALPSPSLRVYLERIDFPGPRALLWATRAGAKEALCGDLLLREGLGSRDSMEGSESPSVGRSASCSSGGKISPFVELLHACSRGNIIVTCLLLRTVHLATTSSASKIEPDTNPANCKLCCVASELAGALAVTFRAT